MKPYLLALLLLLCTPIVANAYEVGIYQPCPFPGECNPEEWLQLAREMGFNAVLVEVVDSDGRALYNSSALPMADYVAPGYLESVLEIARGLGMKVYAWVNLPHAYWLEEHPEWVVIFSNGMPASAYTEDYFYRVVSPARVVREGECIETLRTLFQEIAGMGFDGIDINDNFQFPDWTANDETLTSSFDEFTVKAFEKDTGLPVEGEGPGEWAGFILSNYREKWEEWKAEQVSSLIEMIKEFVYEIRPQPIRPHLLIHEPETYGLNYSRIAEITGHLYYMVPETEGRETHLDVANRRFYGAELAASTYLFQDAEEAWRRAVWLHDADSLFIYDYPLVYEKGLWDEAERAVKAFLNAKLAEEKVGRLKGIGAVSVYADPWEGVPVDDVREALDSGAGLIELDVGLSDYEVMYDDELFSDALRIVGEVADIVHERNASLVVYLPALEIDSWGPWFSKDHWNWLQTSLDGRRLVVKGLDVPWLEPEAEVAWVSPFSPHKEVVEERARELIRAGADGIWLDVPHLPSYITDEMDDLWPDASPRSLELFKQEYGVSPPTSADWDDLSFHYWLEWRHKVALDFVLNVTEAVMAEGGFLMVESSSVDHGANEQGFDPTYLINYPYVAYVPEIGPPSWEGGVRSLEEWGHYFAMLKHAKASSRAVLPLTYGADQVDSSRQLGLILPLFDNFFETNSGNGLMTGTVGAEFRERAFSLVRAMKGVHERPSKVALLFSRNTRDHIDGYVWGPYEMEETVHMAAFREAAKRLMEMHVPFDVVVIEEAESLNDYEAVVAPELLCLDDRGRGLLEEYKGTIIRIGELGTYDEYGTEEMEGMEVGDGDWGLLKGFSLGDYPEWLAAVPVEMEGSEGLVLVNLTGEEGEIRLPADWLVFDFSNWKLFRGGRVDAPETFYIAFERKGRGGVVKEGLPVLLEEGGGRLLGPAGIFEQVVVADVYSYGPFVEIKLPAGYSEAIGTLNGRLMEEEAFGVVDGLGVRLPPQLLWLLEVWIPTVSQAFPGGT